MSKVAPAPMAGLSGSAPGPKSAPGALTKGVSGRVMRPMVNKANTNTLKRNQSTGQILKKTGGSTKKEKRMGDDGEEIESDDEHIVETSSIYNKVGSKSDDDGKVKYTSSKARIGKQNTRKFSMTDDDLKVAAEKEAEKKTNPDPKMHFGTSKRGVVIQTVEADEIQWLSKIGTGSTAEVFKVKWIGNIFAAKKFRTDAEAGGLEKATARMERETNVHSMLPRHNNIMMFSGSSRGETPSILVELVIGATLQAVLRKYDDKPDGNNPWPADRPLIYPWMVDFMKGVAFLHDRQHVVVHRDLNPANLMLSDGMKRLKIFDFGMAKTCPKDELLRHHQPQKDDVYCCALIMWEMSTGFLPPGGYTVHLTEGFAENERRPDLAQVRWPELKQIIDSSWRGDKDLRFEATEVLQELEHLAVVDPSLVACRSDMGKKGLLGRMLASKDGQARSCTIL